MIGQRTTRVDAMARIALLWTGSAVTALGGTELSTGFQDAMDGLNGFFDGFNAL